MITEEYRGHRLCNAVSAIVKWFPKVSGGKDLVKEVQDNPGSLTTLGYLYASFRMAADKEAREKPTDEIIDEIEYADMMDAGSPFYVAINRLMNGEGENGPKNQ